MRRTVIIYGLSLAALIFVLKQLQFRYLMRDLSIEFYMGLLAVIFTAVGIWAGLRLTRKKIVTVPISNFQFDPSRIEKLGISKREHEVLELMARGLTNQEIADKLFVSVNTIKTHTANLFSKLDVKRRTQAVQRGERIDVDSIVLSGYFHANHPFG
ncbi:MAG: helix-turn-helix transcriptional regulator [Bacteroidota bacterium]